MTIRFTSKTKDIPVAHVIFVLSFGFNRNNGTFYPKLGTGKNFLFPAVRYPYNPYFLVGLNKVPMGEGSPYRLLRDKILDEEDGSL